MTWAPWGAGGGGADVLPARRGRGGHVHRPADDRRGHRRDLAAKTPSTPADLSIGVLAGLDKVSPTAAVDPGAISHLMHGTTVATNAILEGKGARVGLVVTEGYLGRSSRWPGRSSRRLATTDRPKPEPLAALEHTVEVAERVGLRGEVLRPLDEDSVRAAGPSCAAARSRP